MGELTCPSGELVVVDAGYLGLWSGAGSPADVDAGIDVPPATDLEVVGPDAEAAARSFDRQAGTTLYDIPDRMTAEFTAMFDRHRAEHGLNAHLQATPRRPHRERARRAASRGGEQFIVHGVPCIAVGGVPTDRTLPVIARRVDFGPPIGENWHSFRVPFADPDRPVAGRRPLGVVGVDHARVLFGDADALSSWEHERPADGRADVAFWGRGAREAVRVHGAGPLVRPGEEGVFGWTDLPLEEAEQRAIAVMRWAEGEGTDRRLRVDFRPHSDHYRLMEGIRADPSEASTVTVGGARLVGAMTGYGDGLFPVELEHDRDGIPMGVRVLFADPDHLERFADFLRRHA